MASPPIVVSAIVVGTSNEVNPQSAPIQASIVGVTESNEALQDGTQPPSSQEPQSHVQPVEQESELDVQPLEQKSALDPWIRHLLHFIHSQLFFVVFCTVAVINLVFVVVKILHDRTDVFGEEDCDEDCLLDHIGRVWMNFCICFWGFDLGIKWFAWRCHAFKQKWFQFQFVIVTIAVIDTWILTLMVSAEVVSLSWELTGLMILPCAFRLKRMMLKA